MDISKSFNSFSHITLAYKNQTNLSFHQQTIAEVMGGERVIRVCVNAIG